MVVLNRGFRVMISVPCLIYPVSLLHDNRHAVISISPSARMQQLRGLFFGFSARYSNAQATAYWIKMIRKSLTFVRVEPYVVPKKSLTGDASERVDSRVLQVIYSIANPCCPLYVGQQVDAFIDASTSATEEPNLSPLSVFEALM